MSKNVSDVVVAKHKGRTIVTAGSVISKHVHLLWTSLAVTTAERRTWKRRIKKWNTQSELEGRSEDIRLEPKTNEELEAQAAGGASNQSLAWH